MPIIAPSILTCDFCRLGDELADVKKAGADWIHVDIMDGTFVPNISIGLPVVSSMRKSTDQFLDVHLMIDRPLRYVEAFASAGADLVNCHIEADDEENIHAAIAKVHALGKKAGITLKPATPASAAEPFLKEVELVLIMTVEPGFGGQKFMADMMPKVTEIRRMLDEVNPDCHVEVDGGVNADTAKICVAAGADVLVAGSAVINKTDRAAAVTAIRGID